MDVMLIAAGAMTGLPVGLTGVGGCALMTPPLLLVFDVAPQAAVGTDLWFAAITTLFASRMHHDHGLFDWPVVRRLWLGSFTASALTLVWMKLHPVDETAVTLLETAIAVAIFAGMDRLLIGNVDFGLHGNLLLGSIPAVFVGALLSARLPHLLLRDVLSMVLLLIGAKLWWTRTL
jgi:uncharacterized membrane protein YfcA